ncbi:MAG: hypothetical protein Q8M76_02695 [Spirochaetaceae bacterium]|nr:hypothetical protein [Spirochaetaceae bacterium]
MKKSIGTISILVVFMTVVGCVSAPAPITPPVVNPDQPMVKVYPPQIIEHKGTAFGRDYPKWMDAALDGSSAVEKLPDFSNQYIVVVQEDGQDLAGVQLAAARLNAQTTIAAMIATRVKDTFAGAQVGDKDTISTYMERCVKSSSEARFTGFALQGDWWAKLQTFSSKGKPDKQLYRIIQVWGIDKALLKQQVQAILRNEAAKEPKTAETQKAMDSVQQTFFDGF